MAMFELSPPPSETKIWQADFYKSNATFSIAAAIVTPDSPWRLLICDRRGNLVIEAHCPQKTATVAWLTGQLMPLIAANPPHLIQCFRPQSLGLIQAAVQTWGIPVEATRRTPALKRLLSQNQPPVFNGNGALALEPAPPQPLPEAIWGEKWRFGSVLAGDLADFWGDRPIPYRGLPDFLLPIHLGLASTVVIPGMVIYGGRQSLRLAQWLAENKPFALNFIANEPGLSGGVILEADLSDRWILATFQDAEVAQAAQTFQEQKKRCQGLHFLLVQPDDSGVTESGFWLLQDELVP